MIASTLLKAILKFYTTKKLLEFRNSFTSKIYAKYAIFQAFKHILDLISKCAVADWTEQNKFSQSQTIPNLSNLAFSSFSENEQNGVKMAIFLFEKIATIAQQLDVLPPASHDGNLFSLALS